MCVSSRSVKKVALVTGGASGIGRAISNRLAKDGFQVAVADIAREEASQVLKELHGGRKRHIALGVNIIHKEEVDKAFRKAREAFGQVDVAVANAGITRVTALLEQSLEEFRDVQDVNLMGALHTFRAAAQTFIDQKTGGKIIAASSIAGHRPIPYSAAYSISKSAIVALTQAAAIEWAQHGITVNAYAPGFTQSKMWDVIDPGYAALGQNEPGSALKKFASGLSAMQRPGTAEEIAGLVSFLASSDSSYVTGQTIHADGGTHFVS
ncbi:putative short chain oxidoreductase [Acaromyces ingoldii]|uniref:Putative short chain oxidoreductase n=1 Tax=Acaromyces ingoldii TaxID=215250 RepID=A0A316YBX2_9BASI|nr:putative short chain oxidoreductase [Acaromyces ingoldii]PWN86731.1 putative short chain oxidoreductase [Acaromyces ingoldii]